MDPVSSITAAIHLVMTYIDQMSSKNETIEAIRITSARISTILSVAYGLQTQSSPSPSPPTQSTSNTSHASFDLVETALGDMQDILLKVYDNLQIYQVKLPALPELWKGDRHAMWAAGVSLVAPGIVLGKLRTLQERLDRRSNALMLTLIVVQDQKAAILPGAVDNGLPAYGTLNTSDAARDLEKSSPFEELHNQEVKRFWEQKIGHEVGFFVSSVTTNTL